MKTAQLKELARLEGIQTEYNSAFGTTLQAAPEGLVHVLNALEIPVSEDLDNVEQLLDRDGPAETLLMRLVHDAHPAPAQFLEQLVVADDGLPVREHVRAAMLRRVERVCEGASNTHRPALPRGQRRSAFVAAAFD